MPRLWPDAAEPSTCNGAWCAVQSEFLHSQCIGHPAVGRQKYLAHRVMFAMPETRVDQLLSSVVVARSRHNACPSLSEDVNRALSEKRMR